MVKRGRKAGFEFISNRKAVTKEIAQGLEKNLHLAIRIWQRSIIQQLSGQRSGREYYVPGTKTKYIASAPGESPAVVTGALRRSYVTEVDRRAMVAYLGSNLDKSIWLERGTSTMEPRPALEPSFMKVRPQIAAALGHKLD